MFVIQTEEWLMASYDWQLDKMIMMIMMLMSALWNQNKHIDTGT